MTSEVWGKLQAPFPREAITWRITELSSDGSRARLRPQLAKDAIFSRLDEAAGKTGWSNSYQPIGDQAVACNLTVAGVTRSAVVDLAEEASASSAATEALAKAAEQFDMRVPVEADPNEWVDLDPETGTPLYEPAAMPAPAAEPAAPPAASEAIEKSAGQQAIDRLVERLKLEGRGLEAAKLLVEYGGYGENPQKGRELYSKLRALLKREAVGDS